MFDPNVYKYIYFKNKIISVSDLYNHWKSKGIKMSLLSSKSSFYDAFPDFDWINYYDMNKSLFRLKNEIDVIAKYWHQNLVNQYKANFNQKIEINDIVLSVEPRLKMNKCDSKFYKNMKTKQYLEVSIDNVITLLTVNFQLVFVSILPKDNNIGDGWLQRINKMDQLFNNVPRLYLNFTTTTKKLSLYKNNELQYELSININCINQYNNMLDKILSSTEYVYIQTLHNCEYISNYLSKINYVVDMHGIVPEEEHMLGNVNRINYFSKLEQKVIRTATKIVVVTNKMKEHFENKYTNINQKDKFIVVPILVDMCEKESNLSRKTYFNHAIYSGGIQVWQNVNLITNMVNLKSNQLHVTFLSQHKNEIEKKVENKRNTNFMSCTKNDVANYLINKNFGFLLRDQHDVNKVSCPTKLIEYIYYMVVPILKSPYIGDFFDNHLKYVSYDDICSNKLPNVQECETICDHNLKIYDKIRYDFNKGANQLKNFILNKNSKINIVFQLNSFDKGGLEQVVLNVIRNIDTILFNIIIFVNNSSLGDCGTLIKNNYPNIEVILLNNDLLLLDKFLSNTNICLVNLHYSLFGIDLYKKHNVKIIYTIHNTYIWVSPQDVKYRINVYAKIDKFIAVSTNVKTYFCNKFKINANKVELITNGFCYDDYKECGINTRSNDVFTFLNVASFSPVKCQHLIIEALHVLIRRIPNIKLILIGNIIDQKYYDTIINKITQYKLNDHVEIIEYLSKTDLGFYYQTSNALVQPSLIEGWSNVIMEAIHFKLPIIMTDVGSAKDIIKNNDVGIVIDKHQNLYEIDYKELNVPLNKINLSPLINSMKNMVINKGMWTSDKNHSYQKIIKHHSNNIMVAKYSDIFFDTIMATSSNN
jgi:glycosyltransferase involved in cell wall biosynthesis